MNIISQLTDEHIEQLVALYRREFWCNQRDAEKVRRMLEHTDIVLGAVNENNELVGFIRVLTDYCYKATIYDLIVRDDYRGSGLGKRLMDMVIHHPELQGVEHYDLHCLPEMIPFYEKWQFSTGLGNVITMRRVNS